MTFRSIINTIVLTWLAHTSDAKVWRVHYADTHHRYMSIKFGEYITHTRPMSYYEAKKHLIYQNRWMEIDYTIDYRYP